MCRSEKTKELNLQNYKVCLFREECLATVLLFPLVLLFHPLANVKGIHTFAFRADEPLDMPCCCLGQPLSAAALISGGRLLTQQSGFPPV